MIFFEGKGPLKVIEGLKMGEFSSGHGLYQECEFEQAGDNKMELTLQASVYLAWLAYISLY